MKKTLPITIMFILMLSLVNAIDYNQITGDSLFVVGVEWQKANQNNTDYTAYVTVDLNYGQYKNPLGKYQIVDRYNWNNWWATFVDFGNGGNIIYVNGTSYQQLDFYYELPTVNPDSDADKLQCEMTGNCNPIAPEIRAGYYGLPFYIKEVQFMCDVNNPSKGSLYLTPSPTETDIITLTRPDYDGIPTTNIRVDTVNFPLGFLSLPSDRVRYNSIPVPCLDMDTTTNAKLSFTLKPNPIYRQNNPNMTGSETWEYSDIISNMPSLTNTQNLPYQLNIDFNYTGNWWDYTISNNESLQNFYDSTYFGDVADMDCEIDLYNFMQLYPTATRDYIVNLFGSSSAIYLTKDVYTTIKLSELYNINQQISHKYPTYYDSFSYLHIFDQEGSHVSISQHINTGEGLTCNYEPSDLVTNLNAQGGNDVIKQISIQTQKEIAHQYGQLENKLKLKRFIVEQVIPFFVVMLILIFYAIELVILAFVIFGLIPFMFNQFMKGMKDAFDIDDLIRQYKKR